MKVAVIGYLNLKQNSEALDDITLDWMLRRLLRSGVSELHCKARPESKQDGVSSTS